MRADLELIDEQIFTRIIEYVLENLLDIPMDKSNFSMTNNNPSDTQLPFVFIDRIVATETAVDLECDTINGGLFTYQVKVTSNNSQTEVKKIMKVVEKAFKSMAFRGTSLSISSDNGNLHTRISRWQREINEGDSL